MSSTARINMADMPVQYPEKAVDAVEARARFFNSGNAFNQKLPRVPATAFDAERDCAFAAFEARATRLFACDQSRTISSAEPATTPLMLARYAAVGPDAPLEMRPRATGCIWYVIQGAGSAKVGLESFDWAQGDVFLTPGGLDTRLRSAAGGALLWLVTDEPLYAFGQMIPAPFASLRAVRYPAAEIERQLRRVVEASTNDATSGVALIFSSGELEASCNVLPTLTLSLNTVPPGEHQRTHLHNSAAITLILKGDGAYSLVDGVRCDWSANSTLVTPATDPHSHHNPGAERAIFLIVQDGALYYHARTMGFHFLESVG